MTLTDALAALSRGDEDALLQFTRDVVRLAPADEWMPYVAQAVWLTETRIGRLGKPHAYIRAVAKRLREQAEASLFGVQLVRDEHRRVIGYVVIGSYVRRSDGCVCDGLLSSGLRTGESALPYIPFDERMPRERSLQRERSDRWQAKWIPTNDPDEQELQKAQMAGVSRRTMADRLGWSKEKVEAVWRRLHRKRAKEARCCGIPRNPG